MPFGKSCAFFLALLPAICLGQGWRLPQSGATFESVISAARSNHLEIDRDRVDGTYTIIERDVEFCGITFDAHYSFVNGKLISTSLYSGRLALSSEELKAAHQKLEHELNSAFNSGAVDSDEPTKISDGRVISREFVSRWESSKALLRSNYMARLESNGNPNISTISIRLTY